MQTGLASKISSKAFDSFVSGSSFATNGEGKASVIDTFLKMNCDLIFLRSFSKKAGRIALGLE